MELFPLGSSSAGNAWMVRSGPTSLLIDAGFGARTILERFAEAGGDVLSIRAILVSHEHRDHVQSVGVLARQLKIPIFATAGTVLGIAPLLRGGENVQEIEAGCPFTVDELQVEPFSVPHDAADPVQFVVRDRSRSLAVVTDLGLATQLVIEKVAGVNTAVIEANHDRQMLLDGPYPWAVKQRISSGSGHLSNDAGIELAITALGRGVEQIVMAHLSATNNRAELVSEGLRKRLIDMKEHSSVPCHVMYPGQMLPPLKI